MGYASASDQAVSLDFHRLLTQPINAVVVRSCAGRVRPQLVNLLFLDHVLQFTDVMIVHHNGQYAVACTRLTSVHNN